MPIRPFGILPPLFLPFLESYDIEYGLNYKLSAFRCVQCTCQHTSVQVTMDRYPRRYLRSRFNGLGFLVSVTVTCGQTYYRLGWFPRYLGFGPAHLVGSQ